MSDTPCVAARGAPFYTRTPAFEHPDAASASPHPVSFRARPATHGVTALRVRHSGDAAALLRFAAPGDASALPQVRLHCTHLAGPRAPEAWFDSGSDAALRVVSIEVPESGGDIEAAAALAYRRLIDAVRPSSHPYMVRVWNYLDDINGGSGDEERYRRFCVGRASAVDAMFNDPPPAATAIGNGLESGLVQVVALCATTPPVALENPRQTPAWQYPRDYGRVSPGFSRGALVGEGSSARLLASGTASIVGHVSQHVGDAMAQARESLANLDVLLDEAGRSSGLAFALSQYEALRVYLRHASDLAAVEAVLAARLPMANVWFLQGDVCRRELLVELEGVFAPV